MRLPGNQQRIWEVTALLNVTSVKPFFEQIKQAKHNVNKSDLKGDFWKI